VARYTFSAEEDVDFFVLVSNISYALLFNFLRRTSYNSHINWVVHFNMGNSSKVRFACSVTEDFETYNLLNKNGEFK
jgi:hypothetical protein